MYKLEQLLRCTTRVVDKTNWILMCVNDLLLNNVVTPSELSLIQLCGKGKGKDRKGTSSPRFALGRLLTQWANR